MKLTYLGTAAAEGFPAVFCNCSYCREARRLGGKNIRTRSQALVNDDLLLDLPADTYLHFLREGIEGDTLRYLLITHAHSDHFYAPELIMRNRGFANDVRVPTLKMVCAEYALRYFIDRMPKTVEIITVKPFDVVELGDYRITALPARHMPGGDALFYLIEGDKTLLYAHDTGYFFDEVFDFLKEKKIVLDMISLDCTSVELPNTDEDTHMALPNARRVIDRLRNAGVVTDDTVCYVNHFSHNAAPLHDTLCARAAAYGFSASFDGCRVEF